MKPREREAADEAAAAWAMRGIVFHSWRHFFNSLLINRRIPIQKVQALTGHSADSTTEHYYHAGDFTDMSAIQEDIFKAYEGICRKNGKTKNGTHG